MHVAMAGGVKQWSILSEMCLTYNHRVLEVRAHTAGCGR